MKIVLISLLAIVCNHFIATGSPVSPPSSEFAQLRTNLYITTPNGSLALIDGTLTQYDTNYSNNIDGMDARKMFNPSENFGMLRGSTVLIIERRHTIQNDDTIFFKMWNMQTINYKLDLVAYNLNTPGRIGILKDKFLNQNTPFNLNDTTSFNFSITADPASKAPDRFMVVFNTPNFGALPTFTFVKALEHNNFVDVNWITANEKGIKQYEIEKSVTGDNFIKLTVINANNTPTNNYHWVDIKPEEGYNYYRIGSVTTDGKINYSPVMKLYIVRENQSISIYPNPVAGNNLNLKMINQPEGLYELKLMNLFGQIFMTKKIQYNGPSSIENISPEKNIPKGYYQLEITLPTGNIKVINVVF